MDICRHGIAEKSGGPWNTHVLKIASGINALYALGKRGADEFS